MGFAGANSYFQEILDERCSTTDRRNYLRPSAKTRKKRANQFGGLSFFPGTYSEILWRSFSPNPLGKVEGKNHFSYEFAH